MEEFLAEPITNLRGAFKRLWVAGFLVPEQQPQHDMIMSPDIPHPLQPFVFRKRSQITIFSLLFHQLRDEFGEASF